MLRTRRGASFRRPLFHGGVNMPPLLEFVMTGPPLDEVVFA